MRVIALKAFGGTEHGSFSQGQVFDLPDGVDWLEAGLVRPVKAEPESATVEAEEKAVKPRTKRRRKTIAKKTGSKS